MIILVDLDGVLADFEQGFLVVWQKLYPDRLFIPIAERTTFYVEDQYPKKYLNDIKKIKTAPNFFSDLPIITGAKKAIEEMIRVGHTVMICSSPLTNYKNCVEGKYDWVAKNLGQDFVKNLILTKDKTLVQGDYLIDDLPNITGKMKPTWTHLLFETSSNSSIKGAKKLTWENWRNFIT